MPTDPLNLSSLATSTPEPTQQAASDPLGLSTIAKAPSKEPSSSHPFVNDHIVKPLQTLGAALDTPLMLADPRIGFNPAKLVTELHNKGLRGAEDEYGPLSAGQEKYIGENNTLGLGGAAKFLQKHPFVNAVAGFGAEFANPANYLLGPVAGIAGKAVGATAKAIPGVEKAATAASDVFGRTFSKYHDITKELGPVAEQKMRAVDKAGAKIPPEVDDKLSEIFNGVTPEQKLEIIRRSRGGEAKPVAGKLSDDKLNERAGKLTDFISWVDTTQKDAGAIRGAMRDSSTYYPLYLKSMWKDPRIQQMLGDETLTDTQRGNMLGRFLRPGTKFRVGSMGKQKTYGMLDQALQSDKLSEEFFKNPETNLRHWALQRLGNVVAKDRVEKLQDVQGIKLLNMATENLMPRVGKRVNALIDKMDEGTITDTERRRLMKVFNAYGTASPGFTPYRDIAAALQYGGDLLQGKQLRESAVNLLKDVGGAPPAAAQDLGKFISVMNNIQRFGLITNPAVHLTWNLMFNTMSAGMNPLNYRYLWMSEKSPEFAELLERADKAGAINYSSRSGDFFENVAPYKGLDIAQKVRKASNAASNLNSKIVFDWGEKRMSMGLFKSLVDKGMSDGEAAVAVSKAVGDGVSMSATEKALQNAFFFYPWVRTIIPFYLKTTLQRPQWTAGIANRLDQYNQQMGDHNAEDWQMALPGGKRMTLLLPQRILSDLLSPNGWVKMISSHANLPLGTTMRMASTLAAPAQDPSQNFNVLYNKNAPEEEQIKQLAGAAAERMVPLPLQGLEPDNLKKLLSTTNKAGAVTEGFFGLRPYDTNSPTNKRAWELTERMNGLIQRIKRSNMSEEQKRAQATAVYYLYAPRIKALTGAQ